MAKRTILGVMVTDRLRDAPKVQKILSDHGCNIKTRLGLHDVGPDACSPNGLLILEAYGKASEISELEKKLKGVNGLIVKKMVF